MSELILPPGVDMTGDVPAERGVIVNETELPDHVVQTAIETFFEENASVLGIVNGGTSFKTYANEGGSILARGRYRTPSNVIEEVILARDIAERDDDVAPTIGACLAIAFGDGMQNNHEDEVTIALFDEIARLANLDSTFLELYREWLIAGEITTASVFTREDVTILPASRERSSTRSIAAPRVATLPTENVMPIGNDMFGTAPLYWRPQSAAQEDWLREFFASSTTAARKAEMRRQDPVLTTLLTEELRIQSDTLRVNALFEADNPNPATGEWVYRLNPLMVHRTTMPKGGWLHPRPPLTRNFALLEAKRLLNLMDYALLEGGANFLVVAKKGSDQRPALPEEISNLHGTIRKAARSGVLIGDHRLAVEIITPDLGELLNDSKRRLVARKLSRALLRLPDFGGESGSSGQGALTETEIITRVITSDRRALKRHVENHVYRECARRNDPIAGAASIWFPKVILQGAQFFTDLVLKLRDRGDISRKSTVEAGGFSYKAELQQRKREKAGGDDRVLTPPPVPFDGAQGGAGPQDNGGGRPRGSGPNNGRALSRQRGSAGGGAGGTRRVIARNAGETVRAMYDESVGGAVRIGDLTVELLDEYADTVEMGRMTPRERDALERIAAGEVQTFREGALTIVPVNSAYEIGDVRPVRLATGLSALIGNRVGDDAVVTRALVFRTPEFNDLQAEEQAVEWGWGPVEADPDPPDERALVVQVPEPRPTRREVEYDAAGRIVAVLERPS